MPKKNENYEEMISKLEAIVNSMEKGELSLDDSIKNYEEGIKTCNKLYKLLNDAEGKIKVLNSKNEEVSFEQSGE